MKILVVNGLSAILGGSQTNLINLMTCLPKFNCKVIFILNSANLCVFEDFKSEKITLFEAKNASRSIFHRVFWEIVNLL